MVKRLQMKNINKSTELHDELIVVFTKIQNTMVAYINQLTLTVTMNEEDTTIILLIHDRNLQKERMI